MFMTYLTLPSFCWLLFFWLLGFLASAISGSAVSRFLYLPEVVVVVVVDDQ